MLEIESKQIDLLRTFRDVDIAVVFYSPFSCGMPTGTFPLLTFTTLISAKWRRVFYRKLC